MADKRARKNEDEEQEKRNILPQDGREGPLDPYTGEVEPPAPDAYKVTEIVPTDPDNRKGENFLMDEEVLDDFADRQGLASGGRQKLEEKLNKYNEMDPTLSGGDVDAAWDDSIVSGEESVGGSAPTPDQDIVDDLGEAAGLTYRDNEPLDSDKKVLDRDRNRWELNPASADDEADEEGLE